MKHKLIILTVFTTAVITIAGCKKRLDIVPFQSLPPEQALATESDIAGLLVGAYDGLQSTSAYGGDIQLMSDIWANRLYLRFRGTFAGLLQIASITTTSNPIQVDNGWAASLWRQSFYTINTANLVLENLSKITSSATKKDRVEGEALFIRGSLYFELARLYGKTWGDGDNNTNLAVPLVLNSTPFEVSKLTDANYPARASVAAIYNQAKADLQRAATILPTSNAPGYATRWAAMAQLSRIALMQGDYPTARDMAHTVISSTTVGSNPQYALASPFSNLYFNFINFGGVAPREYIFYMRVTQQDGTNGLNTYYGQTVSSIPGTSGRGDLDVQSAWVNLHESGDKRRSFFIVTNRRLTQKHLDRFGHVPVIRLSEMYLTRAEANYRLGTTIGATPLEDVNVIRNRVELPSLLAIASVSEIIKERNLELAFEGHYLHDLKRLRLSTAGSNGTNGPAWNSPSLVMPIPQREMDVNKNLVQNPGY
jgi:hypothetical protein